MQGAHSTGLLQHPTQELATRVTTLTSTMSLVYKYEHSFTCSSTQQGENLTKVTSSSGVQLEGSKLHWKVNKMYYHLTNRILSYSLINIKLLYKTFSLKNTLSCHNIAKKLNLSKE